MKTHISSALHQFVSPFERHGTKEYLGYIGNHGTKQTFPYCYFSGFSARERQQTVINIGNVVTLETRKKIWLHHSILLIKFALTLCNIIVVSWYHLILCDNTWICVKKGIFRVPVLLANKSPRFKSQLKITPTRARPIILPLRKDLISELKW